MSLHSSAVAPAKHSPAWWRGWLPLVIAPPLVWLTVPADWPGWGLMWLVAIAIYAGAKWLVWRRSSASDAPPWQQAAFLLAWPGLDADGFLSHRPKRASDVPSPREWLFAAAKLALGIAMICASTYWLAIQPLIAGWVGMIGIVFVLHFGLFHLLSCWWRSIGLHAPPLMQWPIAARSLSEFWGRRWNVAFRDLTHRFLFRPLIARMSAPLALLLGFSFSGLIHDAVISLPAGGGYGGPTAFFLLQGFAILLERSALGRQWGLGRGWRGRLFTSLVLLTPAALLFHPAFVLNIVVPFLECLRAALL